jgi:hypothetical protein
MVPGVEKESALIAFGLLLMANNERIFFNDFRVFFVQPRITYSLSVRASCFGNSFENEFEMDFDIDRRHD